MRPARDIEISIEELRKRLRYDAATKKLYWLNGQRAGQEAGCLDANGYGRVFLFGQNRYAHRVIWALEHGEWPTHELDHRNGEEAANAIDNLRPATSSEQAQNRPFLSRTNSSGVLGVTWNAKHRRWYAHIKINSKQIHLGSFLFKDDAIAARLKAKRELHPYQPIPR